MRNNSGNFFLVIEGPDGSGKTEIAHQLAHLLQKTCGNRVKLTFEPHDPSCAGLFIRQVLMKRITSVSPRTLALAFAVNRADHCDREIVPFLSAGTQRLLISDRYYLSSLVYQRTGQLTMGDIMYLNEGVKRPDLTIYLDTSTSTCYERMKRRTESKDLFERNVRETRQKYAEWPFTG